MIIVSYKTGGLANQLFLFAHLVAYAAEHDLIIANPTFIDYPDYFEHLRSDIFCRFPPRASIVPPSTLRRQWLNKFVDVWSHRLSRRRMASLIGASFVNIYWDQFCDMNEPIFQSATDSSRWTFVRGWRFRDLPSFNKHAEIIRRFFEPVPAIQGNVNKLMGECRDKAEMIVGVHIRRGDYEEFMNGRYFFDLHQYAALMNQIETLFPGKNILFLICSNETIETTIFEKFDFRLGNNHVVEDMYSFAQCDYLIEPPSTYTHWASFYGRVPLCKIADATQRLALNDFIVADGYCDLPEDRECYQKWNGFQAVEPEKFRER